MPRDDTSRVARSVTGHPYRRILLCLLDGQRKPVSVRDLSRAILTFDCSDGARLLDTDALTTDDESDLPGVETMAAQLHHVHLPRLTAAGLVAYDAEEGLVSDWCHPAVGDRWLTAPPIDRLAEIIADARGATLQAE